MTVSAKRETQVEIKSKFDPKGVQDARRALRQEQREQARQAKQAERDAKRAKKELLSGTRSILGGVGQGLEVALGFQTAGGIAGLADDVLGYEKALARLQITADATPEAMRMFSGQVEQASRDTGINRNEILSAAAAYVALTGQMDVARASTATWAKIAQATGSTVGDIAQTAAAMSQQMGIGPAEMEATFSALAQQGKAGAIELKDLAGVMAQIAPMWGQFKGGKGLEGVRELGAALQIVKRGFGGEAEQTVTGLQGLLVALQKNAGRFKAHGIRIFDVDKSGKETMRGVFDIVDSIAKSDLVKHPDAMEKAFGRVEAYRAYLQLVQNRDALHKFVDDSRDAGLIQRDFNTYMESSSAKLEKSWNAVKLTVIDLFTPERIQKFADGLESLVREIQPLIESLGHVLDAYNAIHRAGKAIRGSLTPGDSPLRGTTPDEIRRVAAENNISEVEANKALQEDYARGLQLKQRIIAAMPDDRVTPEATKLAIAAMEEPTRPGITDYHRIAASYINEAEISPAKYREIAAQVRGEQTDAAIKSGHGYSTPQADVVAEFNRAIQALPDQVGRSVAQAIAATPPNVRLGSEPLVKSVKNAPTLHTNPGGRR